MNWAALLVTFFKGSQALRDIYEKSVILFYAEEQRNDENNSNEIQEEREAIVASLKQPGLTDANRNSLRKRLIALSRL
jgi:hypothetical protein